LNKRPTAPNGKRVELVHNKCARRSRLSGRALGGQVAAVSRAMIRAVFFDLDGTLYDRDLLVRGLAGEQFSVFEDSLGDVSESLFVQRIIELDAHG
jgi:hypothetical protein